MEHSAVHGQAVALRARQNVGRVGRIKTKSAVPARSRSQTHATSSVLPVEESDIVKQRPAYQLVNSYNREVEVAAIAVQAACALCEEVQRKLLHGSMGAVTKDDHSPVTVADYGAQALISLVLQHCLHGGEANGDTAGFRLVAEESAEELATLEGSDLLSQVVSAVNRTLALPGFASIGISPTLSSKDILNALDAGRSEGGREGRHWVLDPVDGTVGFVRGEQYAIALAMIESGELAVSALGCPNMPTRPEWLRHPNRYHRFLTRLSGTDAAEQWIKGVLFIAAKDSGAWMEASDVVLASKLGALPVQMEMREARDAVFCEPVMKANSKQELSGQIAQQLGVSAPPLRVYSQVKYGALARGDADIFLKFPRGDYKEKIWDHAAGALLVTEAGGTVTDAAGRPLDFGLGTRLTGLDRGIVAASSQLHDAIVSAIEDSWASAQL